MWPIRYLLVFATFSVRVEHAIIMTKSVYLPRIQIIHNITHAVVKDRYRVQLKSLRFQINFSIHATAPKATILKSVLSDGISTKPVFCGNK